MDTPKSCMRLGSLLLCFALGALLDSTAAMADGDEPGEIRRKTPSGEYSDPASFFRMHGYMSLSYTEADDALGADPQATPQILVPGVSARTGRNEGGFRNDAALFVGGEPFDGIGGVIEIHFVGDATDPVITEAKMTWDLVDGAGGRYGLRLTAGRYWLPFGIHNGEWFSAINRFSLVSPAASEVIPAHVNEVGIMGEGEITLTQALGLNYVASVGNGVPGFGLPDNVRNTGSDANGNRTVTGRVGLVWHELLDLELGLSAASGDLRAGQEASFDAADPRRYAADFVAWGPDLRLGWQGLGLRGYYYASTEDLGGAPVDELDRDGFTLEPSYTYHRDSSGLSELTLVGRYSLADEETLAGQTLRRSQLGLAINVKVTRTFIARVGFVAQEEDEDLADMDNNAFSFSLTNEF